MLYIFLFPGNLTPMSQLSDQEDSNDTETNRVAGEYNETVPQMPPRFTKPGNMNRVVAKPAGNMLRLKCPAEGKRCSVLFVTELHDCFAQYCYGLCYSSMCCI
jgi:hypothetical protein